MILPHTSFAGCHYHFGLFFLNQAIRIASGWIIYYQYAVQLILREKFKADKSCKNVHYKTLRMLNLKLRLLQPVKPVFKLSTCGVWVLYVHYWPWLQIGSAMPPSLWKRLHIDSMGCNKKIAKGLWLWDKNTPLIKLCYLTCFFNLTVLFNTQSGFPPFFHLLSLFLDLHSTNDAYPFLNCHCTKQKRVRDLDIKKAQNRIQFWNIFLFK